VYAVQLGQEAGFDRKVQIQQIQARGQAFPIALGYASAIVPGTQCPEPRGVQLSGEVMLMAFYHGFRPSEVVAIFGATP
jgi:hypothetical protein